MNKTDKIVLKSLLESLLELSLHTMIADKKPYHNGDFFNGYTFACNMISNFIDSNEFDKLYNQIETEISKRKHN